MNDFARRGLGRGLSALLGEPVRTDFADPPAAAPSPKPTPPAAYTPPADDAFSPPLQPPPVAASASVTPFPAPPRPAGEEEGGPRSIPIELIQRNPAQPRRHFDEAELAELASSIKTHGVLQPILVRPLAGPEGRFEIVAGERRWRAAQIAGLHALPAVVRTLDERAVLEIAIIENVQRADLNPIEEAAGYQALIDKFSRTQAEIAEIVGKSRPHVANMLRLLTLSEDIQEMVRDGRLSAGHARAILTAPDPMALARAAINGALSVREIERLAQKAKDERDGVRVIPDKPEKDADTRAMEASISNALGMAVIITHRGEAGGEIRISYRRLDQLDEISRRLTGGIV